MICWIVLIHNAHFSLLSDIYFFFISDGCLFLLFFYIFFFQSGIEHFRVNNYLVIGWWRKKSSIQIIYRLTATHFYGFEFSFFYIHIWWNVKAINFVECVHFTNIQHDEAHRSTSHSCRAWTKKKKKITCMSLCLCLIIVKW